MARETLAVRGLTPLIRDFKYFDRPVRLRLRAGLRAIGDIVTREARARFAPVNARSAAGYKTRVRQRGVATEQSIRKTTGKHPEYGADQMRRALLPALMSNADTAERQLGMELDRICRAFERNG